jgi:hypothetical protein
VGAALVGAAPAHADKYDLFLDVVHKAHITAQGGDDELIAFGDGICKDLAKGQTFNEIGVGLTAGGDFKSFQAGELIAAAAMELCPQYSDTVKRQLEEAQNQ